MLLGRFIFTKYIEVRYINYGIGDFFIELSFSDEINIYRITYKKFFYFVNFGS